MFLINYNSRQLRSSKVDRFRVREGDSDPGHPADPLLHSLLRGPGGARAGEVRQVV